MLELSTPLAKVLAEYSLSPSEDKNSERVDDTYVNGTCIVTPRRRLARQIKEEFGNTIQNNISHNPKIITIGDWVAIQGETLLAKNQTLLMSSLQSQLIWDEALNKTLSKVKQDNILEELAQWDIEREDDSSGGYAGTMKQKLVAQAQDAWRKIHLYQLDLNRQTFAKEGITRFFYEWSNYYRAICEERNLCDEFMLTNKLLAAIAIKQAKPSQSLWVGFSNTYPIYERLYELIEKHNKNLIEKADAFKVVGDGLEISQPTKCSVEEYENEQDELYSLAHKVKLFSQANPDKRVGVIIPGVEKNWHKVRQLFTASLLEEKDNTDHSAEQTLDERDLPFDMSWGEELKEFPLISSLLDLLQLSRQRIAPIQLVDRFNSPYLVGHKKERIARTRLDSKLRMMSTIYKKISLTDITTKEPLPTAKPGSATNLFADVPMLRSCLNEYFSVENAFAPTANPRQWAKVLGQQINALGWGDIKWSKLERQLWDKLLALLDGLYEAGNVIEAMSRQDALAFMSLQASQIFQPSPAPSKIKILGISEASGLAFDHLFVARMDTTCIPQEQINFFIPFTLAQAAKILGRDNHREKEQAIFDDLKQAAPIVNFSYAQVVEDEDRLPHPLLDNLPRKMEKPEESDQVVESGINIPMELIYDERVAEVNDGESLSNLVGIIKSHSSCPFQSFMAHRVGTIRERQSQEELSQAERGTMLHKILRDLWDKLDDKKSLDELVQLYTNNDESNGANKDLEKKIANSVTKVLEENRTVFLKDDMTFELEERQLRELTRTLVLFETERGKDFKVIATEEKSQVVMGTRKFDLKIDRVDHIKEEDSTRCSHVLIDYKLSSIKYIAAHMQGVRPKEPQLIIYSLLDDELCSLGFITLQPRNKHKCIASGMGLKEDGLFYDKKNCISEEELKDMQNNVRNIYDSFTEGNSQVDPRDNTSCRECDFSSVCRIKESMTTQITA